ncbi:hypothetical protein JN535_20320 [Cellulosimicrobium cellulans]|uniref:hypothetical protein n=1 Tax=Cellulosimicrobium cellulans TaxID=1710 RepID=UPI001966BE66|nr:hypothetical protein [Cellulosimicrobium cellulans]MBN0042497.1 hypothetical protein [Cellulosimicrobium cellulans]
MSPNAPVPPPPPPPGGVPGGVAGRDDAQPTQAFAGPLPGAAAAVPPSFAPTSGPTAQAPRATPADGQPTVVASSFQPATVQHVTPITQLPTAAQPAVPAPSPVPPQRVRYATEQNGFGVAAPVGTAAARPAYASATPQQPRPAYHPPASVAASAAASRASSGEGGSGSTPRPPAGRGGGNGAGGRRSDRLSPGWIAFIVVDALLVIGAIVFAISLLGGGDDGPAGEVTTPPAASATESTEETPPAEPTMSQTFASESRNITCEVTDVSATCVIAQLGTQPAPVAGCDGTVGYKVVLGADGSVEQPCVPAAEQPQPAPGDTAILDYGTSKTVGPFTCDSAETGMTCRDDASGKGFTIARAGIRTL